MYYKNQAIWLIEQLLCARDHARCAVTLPTSLQLKILAHGILASSSPQVLPLSWKIPRSILITHQCLDISLPQSPYFQLPCHLSHFANYLHNHTKGCIINNCFSSEILELDIWIPAFPFYIIWLSAIINTLNSLSSSFIQCRVYRVHYFNHCPNKIFNSLAPLSFHSIFVAEPQPRINSTVFSCLY